MSSTTTAGPLTAGTNQGSSSGASATNMDFGSILASSSSLLSSAQRFGTTTTTSSSTTNSSSGIDASTLPWNTTTSSSLGGGAAAPSLMKSLRELGVASASLGVTQPQASGGTNTSMKSMNVMGAPGAGAHSLLAREGGGFDAARLGRSTRALEHRLAATTATGATTTGEKTAQTQTQTKVSTSTNQATGHNLSAKPNESLDAYLQRQLHTAIHSALASTVAEASKACQDLVDRRCQEEYKKEKNDMLALLAGYRAVTVPPGGHEGIGIGAGVGSEFGGQQEDAYYGLAPPANATTTSTTRNTTEAARLGGGGGSRLPEAPRRHVAVVATLNARQREGDHHHPPTIATNDTLTMALQEFASLGLDLARSAVQKGWSDADAYAGYANGWSLLRCLALARSTRNATATNANLSRNTITTTTTSSMTSKYQAAGALTYLSSMYRRHLHRALRSLTTSNTTTSSFLSNQAIQTAINTITQTTSLATVSPSTLQFVHDVDVYCCAHLGLRQGPSLNLNMTGLELVRLKWSMVYTCLTCGELQAALLVCYALADAEMNHAPARGEEVLVELLEGLVQRQDKLLQLHPQLQESTEEYTLMVPEQELGMENSASMSMLASKRAYAVQTFLSNRDSSRDAGGGYAAKVAALLCLVVEDASSSNRDSAGEETIEDYLFVRLWNYVLSPPSSSFSAAGGGGRGGEGSGDELETLGQVLVHWGPAYFEPSLHQENTTNTASTASSSSSAVAAVAALSSATSNSIIPSTTSALTNPTSSTANQPIHSPSGGWSYTMPLLLSQQFYTALTYLSRAVPCGLWQAVHLALALDGMGIPLVDHGHADADANAEKKEGADKAAGGSGSGSGRRYLAGHTPWKTQNSSISGGGGNEEKEKEEVRKGKVLLKDLLVSYSTTIQGMDPEAALEYLVRIPELDDGTHKTSLTIPTTTTIGVSQEAKKQITRLLLETRAWDVLAGTMQVDGTRSGGALDHHLTPNDVSMLLTEAAERLVQLANAASSAWTVVSMESAKGRGDAADLLALAGRYSEFMRLLNEELSSLLVVRKEEYANREGSWRKKVEQREFWYQAALRFHSTHLSGGRTYVVEVLERNGDLHLGRTFQMLMNLMVFFDKCWGQEWEEALQLMENLNILPKSEEEIAWKAEEYQRQDPTIQRCFSDVALASMEALYQHHVAVKSGIGAAMMAAMATAEQRLVELRKRARVLVVFVGLIDLREAPGGKDVGARLAHLEACMI